MNEVSLGSTVPRDNIISFPVPHIANLINDSDHDTKAVTFHLETPSEPSSPNAPKQQNQQVWSDLDSFYTENRAKIESSLLVRSQDSDGDDTHIEHALEGFLGTANVVLEGLVALGNVHPVLGGESSIAIFAFHGVIKLDITRRDNDRKVLAVILQMQNMMGAMFQLRELKSTSLSQASKDQEKSALQDLVENIARDITSCRGNLKYYSNRKLISKLIKSKSFEKIFADHIHVFELRRSELQLTIASFLAAGINDIRSKLDSMDQNLTKIHDIFRKVETDQERKMHEFMKDNGGPEKCVDNPTLLQKLLVGAGETVSMGKTGERDLANWKDTLKEELVEDLQDILTKHQARFEKLLNVQNNNMKRISEKLEDQEQVSYYHGIKLDDILDKVNTIMVYEEGKFRKKMVKLKDPEIQQVWERMELDRRSVKAKRFVLTFRDHLLTGYSMPTSPSSRAREVENGGNSTLLFSATAPSSANNLIPTPGDSDVESSRWLLAYIDASYVRPIVEAIDEDVSGFISVQEASKFALSRPKELNLLHWMAFWAAGWHMTLVNYQWHIYRILWEMHEARASIHLANSTYLDDYLNYTPFRRVETLLRSLKPLPKDVKEDTKLCTISTAVANADLQRLNLNLKEFAFLLESSSDVTAIGGEARIETWILPLLYLVLTRHLAIIKLGQKIVLDSSEMNQHAISIQSIFTAVDDRLRSLEGKFRHMDQEIDSQFENFAHGLFFAAFKKKENIPAGNTTFTPGGTFIYSLADEKSTSENVGLAIEKEGTSKLDKSILYKLPPENANITFEESIEPKTDPTSITHVLEGSWICFRTLNESASNRYMTPGPIQISFDPVVESKIIGKGINYVGRSSLAGNIDSSKDPWEINFRIDMLNKSPVILQGHYLPDQDIITGIWRWDEQHASHNPAAAAATDQENNSPTELPQSSLAESSEETTSDASKGQTNYNSSSANTTQPTSQLANDEIDRSSLTGHSTPIANDLSMNVEDKESPAVKENLQSEVSTLTILDENSSLGTFWFRRTPPDVIRFRHFLDGPPPNPDFEKPWSSWTISRKRWTFALAAVRERIRHKIGSFKLFRERLAERQQWIILSIQLNYAGSGYAQYRPFPDAMEKWTELIRIVHPTNARLYETISDYLYDRDVLIFGGELRSCENCQRTIFVVGYQCLICINEDMDRHISLCAECYDKPFTSVETKFIHRPSHSLIRYTRTIHKYELAYMVPNEREWAIKLKKQFQVVEKSKIIGNEGESRLSKKADNNTAENVSDEPPRCGCCDKEAVLPCYVCVQCALFFMCIECQRNRMPLMKQNSQYHRHTQNHPLHLIPDSKEVKQIKSDYEQLERQLMDMETRINQGLSALEQKINDHIQPPIAQNIANENLVGMSPANAETAISKAPLEFFSGHQIEPGLNSDNLMSKPISDGTGIHAGIEDISVPQTSNERAEPSPPTLGIDVSSTQRSLEGMFDEIVKRQVALESRVTDRMGALETRVEHQFGSILRLLEELITTSRGNAVA